MARTWRDLVLVTAICSTFAVAGCGGGGGGGGGDSAGNITAERCQNFAAVDTVPSLWTRLSPTGTAPAARQEHAFAYDPAGDRLMIQGGRAGTQSFGDFWVLSNASGTAGTPAWTQLTTGGAAAPQRYRAASAYHASNNTFLLFGGSDGPSGQIKMDLWLLANASGIGGAATWSTVAIGGSAPSPRGSMASAYDETTDTLILFGGGGCSSTACTLYNEAWLIRNATTAPTWQKLSPTGTAPSARANLSAVYDPANDRLILFGGNTSTANPPDSSARSDDTWMLSNVIGTGTPAWTQVTTAIEPPPRAGHSTVFDDINKRMIVFAGGGTDNIVRNDVWILTNVGGTSQAWAEYLTGTPRPSARSNHSAVYTGADKNRMVVFGGDTGSGTFAGDAWVLRNANGLPSSPVSSIVVQGSSTNVCSGYTIQLTPQALDAAGNEVTGVLFTWGLSDPTVATVSSTGLVTPVGPGTVGVTVKSGAVSGTYGPIQVDPQLPPSTGGGGDETWKGTFQITEVFEGVWTCTYTTQGNITLSLNRGAASVSGTNTISGLQDTVVSEDPTLPCPPQPHCSSPSSNVTATATAGDDLAFSFFGLDCSSYPPFTATVTGSSMNGTVTKTSSMTTTTLSFTATKQ